jgi:hypothetical protein
MTDNPYFEKLVIPGLQDFFLDNICSSCKVTQIEQCLTAPISEVRLILRFEGASRSGEYCGTVRWYPTTQIAA